MIGDAFSKKYSGRHRVLRQAWGGGEGDLRILCPAGNVENGVDVLHAGARLNADDGIVDFPAGEIDFSFVQREPAACKAVGAAQKVKAAGDAGIGGGGGDQQNESGRARWRERVCENVWIAGGGLIVKKKKHI